MSKEIEHSTTNVTPASLDDQMRYAEALSSATILPPAFHRQPANVLVALAEAAELGESPWTIMQEMAIIGGKPSFSAKFMRTRIRKAGHLLRESFNDGVARCVIIRADDPEFEHVATWDRAKAEKHGLWGKGHWAKNPELMLANRALSECVREACYEVMGGVGYTTDEVLDFAPSRPEGVTVTEHHDDRPDWGIILAAMRDTGADQQQVLGVASRVLGRQVTTLGGLTQDEINATAAALTEAHSDEPETQEPGQLFDAEVIDENTGEVDR
ncbi:hypothetical protein [Cutibacterium avidum]|uniref:hypothetical protein n=1 Tax=Cutibacterium avidum TaxID=33010 RepID=UPI002FEF0426